MTYITQKYLKGRVFDANDQPDAGKKVTAKLNQSIIRVADGYRIEADKSIEVETDGSGYFILPLHPYNQPGDAPQGTWWDVEFESSGGLTDVVQVPYNQSGGDTPETALNYFAFVVPPEDLDPPSNDVVAALQQGLADVNTALNLALTMNGDGLVALTPPRSRSLVDAADSASSVVTSDANGLMTPAMLLKHNALNADDYARVATVVDGDNTWKYPIFPVAPEPANTGSVGWGYTSQTDGITKVQKGTSAGRTAVAPGLGSFAGKLTDPVTLTTTTAVDLIAVPVLSNRLYVFSCPLGYNAPAAVDLEIGFAGIPAGATLVYFAPGPAENTTGTGDAASVNLLRRTNNQTHRLGGTATDVPADVKGFIQVGGVGGFVRLQGKKANAVSGTVTVLPSVLTIEQW